MLQLPIISRTPGQNFSFNQFASAPNSPDRNKQSTIKDYIKYRQRNLIDFVKSRQQSRQNSPKNLFKVDLIQFAKKKNDSMPSPIIGEIKFLSTQRSIGDSIQIVNDQGMTDETLFDEIIDLENAINSNGVDKKVMGSQKQINHSIMKKEVTEDGQVKINQYTILQELGKGSFGKVKLAKDNNNKKYAVKICDRKKLKLKLLSSKLDAYSLLDKEIAIMKKVGHENIVQLYEVIENPNNDKLYLVLEYMDGPQLLSIKNKSIEIIWKLFRDFMLGLEYLHNFANIAHMDIKPENLLLNQELRLKIADFGVSQIMDDDLVKTKIGTSAYQPPEVFTEEQVRGKPIDVWAAGLTLYQLIYNEHPFISQKQDQLKNNILTQNIKWKETSDLTDLLKRMLDKNPNNRITTQQVLEHPWVTKYGRFPLKNEYQGNFNVTENDIHNAITRLSFNMAIRTLNKLKQKLSQSRQRLRQRKAQESQ
ncbi:unnamed protein product [Paramecium pentaurelia]|uniref:non-specific serine/threonine protein kinase n=1 Tax=Paramecium pentaurelia TaxID=43138 RepID=A0A8S1XTJ8_9CILI|nr:unnamed protein product [Paramecium pentaurelia]